MNWQDWFHSEPCSLGWVHFSTAVQARGLEAAVKNAPVSDRIWGAESTYRAELLTALAVDADEDVRYGVAQNTHAPVEILTALATDADWHVRYAVAENAQTPAELLTTLATDDRWDVRSAVAQNAQTPADVLTTLATDDHWIVRSAVAQNAQTPSSGAR